MNQLIQGNLNDIEALCKNYGVKELYVFGSALTDAFNNESDIDFLVVFSDEIELINYADNYFDFKESLESLLGRPVDLVSQNSLKNKVLVESINRSKEILYAA